MAIINDVDCLANQFTKVTTGMEKGVLTPLDNTPVNYRYATVPTGSPAPTTIDEGIIFRGPIVYDGADALDIYVWPEVNAGRIRETKES